MSLFPKKVYPFNNATAFSYPSLRHPLLQMVAEVVPTWERINYYYNYSSNSSSSVSDRNTLLPLSRASTAEKFPLYWCPVRFRPVVKTIVRDSSPNKDPCLICLCLLENQKEGFSCSFPRNDSEGEGSLWFGQVRHVPGSTFLSENILLTLM